MITYTWFKDALKEDTSKLFRTVGEMKILEKGRASGNSPTRNSNVAFFNNVETRVVQDIVVPYIKECNVKNNWNYTLDFLEDAQYTTYGSDNYYDWHKDWCCRICSRDKDGNETSLKGARKISCSILLSDSSEYEGGDFEIMSGNISRLENGVLLKCEKANINNKGDMVIFKSDTFHRVTPVTKGVRKSLVLWFSGPEFT